MEGVRANRAGGCVERQPQGETVSPAFMPVLNAHCVLYRANHVKSSSGSCCPSPLAQLWFSVVQKRGLS